MAKVQTAIWHGLLPPCPVCGTMVVAFQLPDGEIVRLQVPVASLENLRGAIGDYQDGSVAVPGYPGRCCAAQSASSAGYPT